MHDFFTLTKTGLIKLAGEMYITAMRDKKIKTLILQKTLQSHHKLSICFLQIQFVITSSILMHSMCYCQNKTFMKQLLKGFQQQRVNTLTNMAAIRMGCVEVPVKCFLFCDVWHIYLRVHFRTTGQWIHGYIVQMFQKNVDREYGANHHMNNSPFESIVQ